MSDLPEADPDAESEVVAAYIRTRAKEHRQWTTLVERFYQQIRYGCDDPDCLNPHCKTCQARVCASKGRPYRRPTPSTATALAVYLADTGDDPVIRSCVCNLLPMAANDGAFSGVPSGTAIDDKSLIQRLYNTNAWKAPGATIRQRIDKVKLLEQAISNFTDGTFEALVRTLEAALFQDEDGIPHNTWTIEDSDACFQFLSSKLRQHDDTRDPDFPWEMLYATAAVLILCLEPHPHEARPKETFAQWTRFRWSVENGRLTYIEDDWPKNSALFYKYLSCALSTPALQCAQTFFMTLNRLSDYDRFFDKVYPSETQSQEKKPPTAITPKYSDSLMEVLCVWAKIVFRENWKNAEAEIDNDSPEYCSCWFLYALLKENESNPWPFYKDEYGSFPLVGRELDVVKDPPIFWGRTSAGDSKTHLLEFEFLFSQRERVIFFRSINYHRMMQSFEPAMQAQALSARMYNTYKEAPNSSARREEIAARLRSTVTKHLVIEVRREKILEDVFHCLWRREKRELLRPLKVQFRGEFGNDGLDLGGLQREFFRLAFAEVMDQEKGMFVTDSTTQLSWFRPLSPTVLYQFALVGMLFGLAIYNGITLPVNLPRWFYKWISREDAHPDLEDLADAWPDIHKSLKEMDEYEDDDFEDVFCINNTYTVDLIGRRVELDMSKPFPPNREAALAIDDSRHAAPEAAPITLANKDQYLQKRIRWLLYVSVKQQMNAFGKGFRVFFDHWDTQILAVEDFQKLVEGERHISIAEIKRIARYDDGFYEDHQTIRNFWSVVETYDQDKLRTLVEFVTATDRMPVAGMQDLIFVIMRNGDGGDDGQHLPSSHTCFNRLLLPDYPNKELLEERLDVALQNSKGFGMA